MREARLTPMEAALLMSKGYSLPTTEQRGKQFVAISIKGQFRAEALGRDPQDAVEKVVKVIVRR